MVGIGKGSRQWIAKHSGCLVEVNAMLLAVICCFDLIPSKFHAIPVIDLLGNEKAFAQQNLTTTEQ
jgi:hypothetical protein